MEMKGKFDWNKSSIAPLGTKAMICIATNARNTFAPHCNTVFVTGMAPHHYHLLNFSVPVTHGYRILGTYRLNPTHWTMPMVSEADHIMLAATDLLNNLETMPPPPPPVYALQSTTPPMHPQPTYHHCGTSTTGGGGHSSTKGG